MLQCSGKESREYVLVSMGCMQTLVCQSLVHPRALLKAEWVEVKCVHGDTHKYPIVPLILKYKGKTQNQAHNCRIEETHTHLVGA